MQMISAPTLNLLLRFTVCFDCLELSFIPSYHWARVLSHIKQKHSSNWSKILISLAGKGKRKWSNAGEMHFLNTERLLEIDHRVYCQNSSMPERANKIWSSDNYSCSGVTNAVSSSLKLSGLKVLDKIHVCTLKIRFVHLCQHLFSPNCSSQFKIF